jgi:hypothetical protein
VVPVCPGVVVRPAVAVVWLGVVVCPDGVEWVGALEWLGALACGAGALAFGAGGGELGFLSCCPKAKTGTAIKSASRVTLRRIVPLPLLDFITTS